LVGWLAVCLVGWLVSWLVGGGWLVGWLVGFWLVGWKLELPWRNFFYCMLSKESTVGKQKLNYSSLEPLPLVNTDKIKFKRKYSSRTNSELVPTVFGTNKLGGCNYILHFTYFFYLAVLSGCFLPVGMLIPSPMKRIIFLAIPSFLSELTAFA
jgi:hypothetical protein